MPILLPAFQTGHVKVYLGHVLDVLTAMPEQSVDCVVTSPPYWGD
jgi:DNA modification methylase